LQKRQEKIMGSPSSCVIWSVAENRIDIGECARRTFFFVGAFRLDFFLFPMAVFGAICRVVKDVV
jgi:hypothetical protein